jgi:hypothetical protein
LLTRALFDDKDFNNALANAIPLKRWGEVGGVANLAILSASDESSNIHDGLSHVNWLRSIPRLGRTPRELNFLSDDSVRKQTEAMPIPGEDTAMRAAKARAGADGERRKRTVEEPTSSVDPPPPRRRWVAFFADKAMRAKAVDERHLEDRRRH